MTASSKLHEGLELKHEKVNFVELMLELMTGPVCGSTLTWHLALRVLPEGPRRVTKSFKRGSADRSRCTRALVFLCGCSFLSAAALNSLPKALEIVESPLWT